MSDCLVCGETVDLETVEPVNPDKPRGAKKAGLRVVRDGEEVFYCADHAELRPAPEPKVTKPKAKRGPDPLKGKRHEIETNDKDSILWPYSSTAPVDGDDLPTGVLHPFDDLGLDDERAEQAVEVGDHDYLSGTSLDGLDSGSQALSLGEGSAAGYVDLLMDGDEFQGFPFADGDDPLPLFGGTEAVFPSLGLSDDADGLDGRAEYRKTDVANQAVTGDSRC